jgi:hypothetical protein
MKLTITNVLPGLLLGTLLGGCGSLTSEQLLSVEMYGVSKMPEGATGTRDPKFLTYQLLKVDILSEDGTSSTNLFDGDEEKIFRIVDREQLIYSKKIEELVGNTYGSIQLTFAPEVTGGESDAEALTFTMSNPVLTLTKPFAIEKAKSINVHIRMNWGYTLSDEAMTEPEYLLSMD